MSIPRNLCSTFKAIYPKNLIQLVPHYHTLKHGGSKPIFGTTRPAGNLPAPSNRDSRDLRAPSQSSCRSLSFVLFRSLKPIGPVIVPPSEESSLVFLVQRSTAVRREIVPLHHSTIKSAFTLGSAPVSDASHLRILLLHLTLYFSRSRWLISMGYSMCRKENKRKREQIRSFLSTSFLLSSDIDFSPV